MEEDLLFREYLRERFLLLDDILHTMTVTTSVCVFCSINSLVLSVRCRVARAFSFSLIHVHLKNQRSANRGKEEALARSKASRDSRRRN